MINPSNDNTYELLTSNALSVLDADSKAYLSYNYYSFPDISYVDYQIIGYLTDNSYISEPDINAYLTDNSYISEPDISEILSNINEISSNLSNCITSLTLEPILETNFSGVLDPSASEYH